MVGQCLETRISAFLLEQRDSKAEPDPTDKGLNPGSP